MRKRPIGGVISRVVGFILFLILLGIANLLIPSVGNIVYSRTVDFFNGEIILLLVIMLIGLVNELFWSFYFPFNLIAPITSSVLGIFIANFIYNLWRYIDSYTNTGVSWPMELIYIVVLLVVLIAGYLTILSRHGTRRYREYRDEGKNKKVEWNNERHWDRKWRNVEWDDVGKQFGLAFEKLGDAIDSEFNGKGNKERENKRKIKRRKK